MPSVITIGNSRVHLPETLGASYIDEARRLRDLGRIEEAEAVLREAIKSAPESTDLLVDYARLAERRRDFAAAVARWARVRAAAPQHSLGFIAGAHALRETGRFDEAEVLLRDAMQRFPDEAGPIFEHAWLAHIRRDWAEAISRWEGVRSRFPDHLAGYATGAVALREQHRFDDADQLLVDAMARFPTERAPFVEYAWLATARRDWPSAAQRWEEVRRRYPELPEGYLRGAQALSEVWRYDEAEQLLTDGMARFAQNDALACEHAWIAFRRHEFDEAAQRFDGVRSRFPDCMVGYTAGALALRNLFRLEDAAALLEEAQRRFPQEPRILLDHAQLPMFHPLRRERDPDEALRRLSLLRDAFPDFEEGYVQALRYLREGGRFDEADALAQSGLQRLPGSGALAVEYGNNARDRGNWPEAISRFEAAVDDFPDHPGAAIGLTASLAAAGQHDSAERLLGKAIERFPHNPVVFNEYAQLAARQERWDEALARWSEAQRRFPDQRDIEHRIYEARLHLAERDGHERPADEAGDPGEVGAAETGTSDADPRAATRELVMQFDSLGGTGLGCEFGMFQREFGAEPLGLLRWADMPYEGLVFCLESRFDGVGSDEHTELFINRENSRPEYCTVDRRGFMFMRAFVYEDEMPFDRMRQQVLRRLGYLKDKLIRDLEEGSKVFLYRITKRNLTPEELGRLHAAVRSYGDNTLLYVRYADAAHPNGTVELAAPGLMIGYMDRFKLMPDGQLYASPPSDLWLEVCRNAHALFKAAEASSARPHGSAIQSLDNDTRIVNTSSPEPAVNNDAVENTRWEKLLLRPDDDGTRVRRGFQTLDEVYNTRPAPIFASNKGELYDIVAKTIGDVPLTYLEFGVWHGASIAAIARKFPHPRARFFGFDSFEGLPERWDANNDIGAFNTGGRQPTASDERVSFVKGWFQNTVPKFLDSRSFTSPVLIHYDADIYSSTLFLLTSLCHYIPEYYFIFDEFFPDEVNALREFALAYPVEISFEAAVLYETERPVQLFGRIRRTSFALHNRC